MIRDLSEIWFPCSSLLFTKWSLEGTNVLHWGAIIFSNNSSNESASTMVSAWRCSEGCLAWEHSRFDTLRLALGILILPSICIAFSPYLNIFSNVLRATMSSWMFSFFAKWKQSMASSFVPRISKSREVFNAWQEEKSRWGLQNPRCPALWGRPGDKKDTRFRNMCADSLLKRVTNNRNVWSTVIWLLMLWRVPSSP
jgi:hypothetical protein